MRPPTAPRTILMIENDELDTKLLRGPLELRGYNVLRARDAIRAVQLASNNAGNAEKGRA